MNLTKLKLDVEQAAGKFSGLYGAKNLPQAQARYLEAIDGFRRHFGYEEGDFMLFSSPGRTEICGNHTDHNHGKVLAAAVDIDVIAVVCKTDTGQIRVKSKGHKVNEINLSKLEKQAGEAGRSNALVRGMAARMQELQFEIGGFDAYTISSVPAGSGLSSSAAFELLLGYILNDLYNDCRIDRIAMAQIAQYAENVYFEKPCGLMDQLTVSVGAAVKMDFKNIEHPEVETIALDFLNRAYVICIVNTGGSHADLTDEYAAVRAEMEAVAAYFGKQVLREVPKASVLEHITELRKACGDRAVMRALHFYGENERVNRAYSALEQKNVDGFLACVAESGRSSFMFNQNVFSAKNTAEQGVSLGLCLAGQILEGTGACRVHGGGFAGTIQAFVPKELAERFQSEMECVFGQGSCDIRTVRPYGPIRVL